MRSKSKHRLIVVLCLLFGIATLAFDYFFIGMVMGLFHDPSDAFGQDNWNIMKGAHRVEVIRIKYPNRIATSQPYLGGVLAPEIIPEARWVNQVRDMVATSRYYTWDWRTKCLPVPGVAIRFWKNDEGVELLFCFECDMIILSPIGKQRLDKWIIFDRGRRQALKLMKEVFPNDAVIQGLN